MNSLWFIAVIAICCMSAAAKVSVSDCSAAILALSPSISEVSESMPFKASQSAISVSLCSCNLESACINSAFIWASLKCGVLQPVCRSYFPLHLQTTLRYLSVECHIFEPYQLPHSPQQIFIEKGLRLFWFLPLAFLFAISACTSPHSALSIIPGWLSVTMH